MLPTNVSSLRTPVTAIFTAVNNKPPSGHGDMGPHCTEDPPPPPTLLVKSKSSGKTGDVFKLFHFRTSLPPDSRAEIWWLLNHVRSASGQHTSCWNAAFSLWIRYSFFTSIHTTRCGIPYFAMCCNVCAVHVVFYCTLHIHCERAVSTPIIPSKSNIISIQFTVVFRTRNDIQLFEMNR